ncbi:MAG: hypothetical protein IPM57_06170 [Oligoflexia bacterium]|nr:hypothetical protein [Oligoflexia bacterium]
MGKSRFNYKNQKGAGLTEVVLATAFLLATAVVISKYVVDQKQFNAKLEGSSDCRGDVESLLKDFTNGSNTLVANSLTGSDNNANRTLASVGATTTYSTAINSSGGVNQYANFQNIENSVTRAYLLFKSSAGGTNFCNTSDGLNAQASFFTNSANYNQIISDGKTVKLRIAPVQLTTNVESCSAYAANLPVAPLSSTNQSNDYGFKIKVTVTKPAVGSTQEQVCSGETTIKYNSDNDTPTISAPVALSGNASTCRFSGTVESDEPGSIFECSLNDGVSWSVCSGLTLASTSPNTDTRVTLNVPGITSGAVHRLTIRSVDSAGNRAPASDYVTSPNLSCIVCSIGNIIDASTPVPPGYVGQCSNNTCSSAGDTYVIRNTAGTIIASGSCCPAGTSPATSGTFNGYCTTGCDPSNNTITSYYPYSSVPNGGNVYGTNTTDCTTACEMTCVNYVNCFYRATCKDGPEGNNAWMGSCGYGASFSLGCGATATAAVCDDGNSNHECAYLDVNEGNNPSMAFPTDTRSACTVNCSPGYGQSGSACVECSAGTYSPGGSGVTCSACSGLPSNATWTARTATSNTTSTNCEFECNSGYSWDGSACQLIPVGCGTCNCPAGTCSISGDACACGGGGGGCFVAETEVLMADGTYKKIDEIVSGDEVLATDEFSFKNFSSKVAYPIYHSAQIQTLYTFYLEDGTIFTSNDIHPIYVASEGTYIDSKYIAMMFFATYQDIYFQKYTGEAVRVLDIKTEQKVVPVYNLSVEGLPFYYKKFTAYQKAGHNYFVKGILVHNLNSNKL